MSLTATLKSASTGLAASQIGLRTVSDNIANVNTPGYVRKTVDQAPLVVNGTGMGVQVTGVKRVTDQYLQLATLTATSDSSRWDVVSQYLDNAQSLFGDPAKDSFFFNRLDTVYTSFSKLADDPSSSLLRSQAISHVEDFLSEAGRINDQLSELRNSVDAQIIAHVDRANQLLAQINDLNADISRAKVTGTDSSGSENIQSQLMDELSTLMDVQVQQKATGGVILRSAEGVLLAGDTAPAKLTFTATEATRGYITVSPFNGVGMEQPIQVLKGEIRGLLDLRDDELPKMSDQLGEFVTRASEQINAAHNAASSVPAARTLTGRNTGLDLPTALGGFSGVTNVAVVDSAGILQAQVQIDFDTMTMTPPGGGPNFDETTFLGVLNGALGGAATASFGAGVLSISASDASHGIAFADDATNPSQKAGRGFSHFFGLNDLVRSKDPVNYDTGLRGIDGSGYSGGELSLTLAQPDGKPIRDVNLNITGGGSMDDLLAELNDPIAGVGLYGSFSLDSKGALTFTGTAPNFATLSVTKDTTERGVGGPSMSQLFGLGVQERMSRAERFEVDKTLISNPMRLALSQLNLSPAAGKPAITAGDGRGAVALADSGDVVTNFAAAGDLAAVQMTISRYASEFGGSIGRKAAAAESKRDAAAAVANEAMARRQSVEGVNIDEELVRLTTYQQAFNASARMIQAANELFDVLVQMV